jgi:outer membrane protein insertion porin family
MTMPLSAVTINEIRFEGMVHMSEAVANQMLPIKPGDELNEQKVSEATKKFFGQGYFEDIVVKEEEGVLTFVFTEKPVISRIDTRGWKDGEDDDLDTLLMLKKGSLYDVKRIETAKKRIIDTLQQEGKIDSVVETEVEHLENGSVAVTFIVNEGENITIETLEYTGMTLFEPSDFDDQVGNKERQFMGWFFGRNDGTMQLNQLEYDPMRIRDYYMQFGYLDAKVDNPFVRVDFDTYTSHMSYNVVEGEMYTVNSISVEQVKEVTEASKLMEAVKLETKKPFNIKTLRDDVDRIKNSVADLGYAYVDVKPDYRKNKEEKTVDVTFYVVPGEKVRIRNVMISGNTRTLDRVVRRELYLGPGDLYNLTDLEDSRGALGRTGFFDSNTIEEKRIDNKTMDLVVKVKEAATGNIQVGGGYGSYGGILFNIGVSDMNIWGSGINVGINLERSEMTENYSFNVSNNRLNDSDFSGNIALAKNSIEYTDYTVDSESIRLGIGHRFTRHISGYLGYGYSSNAYSDVNESAAALGDGLIFFQDYKKSALTASLTYDSSDDYYLPRKGIVASQSIEYAGAGGDAEFIKSRTTFNYYQGLQKAIDMDWIFRYKARFFYIEDKGNVPYAERFFMGGMGSVRGYESYSITPRDASGQRIGGKITFSNSAELSFPLMPSAKMRLAAFVDWGMLGEDSLDEFKRGSYGLSVEWFSPVGPVQLIFAQPFNDEEGDDTSAFEFTIGQRF